MHYILLTTGEYSDQEYHYFVGEHEINQERLDQLAYFAGRMGQDISDMHDNATTDAEIKAREEFIPGEYWPGKDQVWLKLMTEQLGKLGYTPIKATAHHSMYYDFPAPRRDGQ